jgi:hypothetical protein
MISFLEGVTEEPITAAFIRHKARAKALPCSGLADDDYVLMSFTSLEASWKSSCVVVLQSLHLRSCDYATVRPGAGVSSCCCSFFLPTIVKYITSRFLGYIKINQVGTPPPLTVKKKV